ncbi:galectin 17 [Lates calcarifer]|uniref:Galectin 17 n=1 Tax=Lates calcarifer TaxID=8187 RepID=A0A4W6EY13_LATCA|nr:galectin 17 [Lates calcarifer]
MKTTMRRHWVFIHLLCFLVGGLVDSSSLSSAKHFLSVTSTVGNQVVLPCSWKSHLGEEVPSACHVQWTTLADTVFEQWGAQKWQAETFRGRAEVPEEKLGAGDCSLIISDVQIGDTGRYESFMVVDGARSKKTRVFIQSVKLSVFDHKTRQSLGPGEDLVLNLHTNHSVRVVFLGSNSSEWSLVWMRGDENTERLEKHPLKEQLTIKNLKSSDGGTYKVLDEQGLAVSTVLLSVEEGSTALHRVMDKETVAGDAAKSSCSALLILSVLVTSFQIPHLL